MYYTKKGGFKQPTLSIQARHLPFVWRQETRRELSHPHQRHFRDAVNSFKIFVPKNIIKIIKKKQSYMNCYRSGKPSY